jgi:hypothetical protein
MTLDEFLTSINHTIFLSKLVMQRLEQRHKWVSIRRRRPRYGRLGLGRLGHRNLSQETVAGPTHLVGLGEGLDEAQLDEILEDGPEELTLPGLEPKVLRPCTRKSYRPHLGVRIALHPTSDGHPEGFLT